MEDEKINPEATTTELIINIISERHSPTLTIKVDNVQSFKMAAQLLGVFSKLEMVDGMLRVQGEIYQQKNEAILKNLRKVIADNGNDLRIWPFYDIFSEMKDGEYFAIVTNCISDEQRDQIKEEILKLNYADYEQLMKFKEEQCRGILDNYDIVTYHNGGKQVRIGELYKKNRRCRYCGQMEPAVKFKKVAHTISEALGNKAIITNDECDTCNETLGREIEQDLVTYLSPLRSFIAVTGKNGVTKVKDDSFALYSEEAKKMRIDLIEQEDKEKQHWEVKEDDNGLKVTVTHPQMVNLQDVYRAVAKYAIGVLLEEQLSHFSDTISWIKKEKSAAELPRLCLFIDNNPRAKEKPSIAVFIRKNDDKTLPYSFVELQVSGVVIFAILPYCDADDRQFTSREEWTHVMDVLKIYKQMPLLKSMAIKSDEPQRMTFHFEFKKR